jgi:hypothetical protein
VENSSYPEKLFYQSLKKKINNFCSKLSNLLEKHPYKKAAKLFN